ncbi:LysM peptidoglycan-binding domain-containing protein [Commensalibacter nepenthis]|uniref:LysM domain-containing protein n=1 Tax=Commensalibacter nepenthis TaxID=3043872 RepID=A0ABT6Q5M6_9PROT|nr:LysM domain-containing protein [Commensalibacter sp. TBRC 10068]MDI2112094.1 LysM domain-containing protein [Commensalibacter sp. TBRC 10068]
MSYDGMPAACHSYCSDNFSQTNEMRNQYDSDIRQIVDTFNRYLKNKYPASNYHDLDWRMVKAIIWIESGHKNSAWRLRPMQIGNRGDAGLKAVLHLKKTRLKNGKIHIQSEGAELIIPPEYKPNLTFNNKEKIRHNPQLNIQAGIAYLLMRHAKYGYRTVINEDTEYRLNVKAGDNLNKIASSHHTTIGIIKQLNPAINQHHLQPGMQLKYKKAIIKKYITGWDVMTFSSVAKKYNAKGDHRYQYKLQYAFASINKELRDKL